MLEQALLVLGALGAVRAVELRVLAALVLAVAIVRGAVVVEAAAVLTVDWVRARTSLGTRTWQKQSRSQNIVGQRHGKRNRMG